MAVNNAGKKKLINNFRYVKNFTVWNVNDIFMRNIINKEVYFQILMCYYSFLHVIIRLEMWRNHRKNSYEPSVHESVDDRSISFGNIS